MSMSATFFASTWLYCIDIRGIVQSGIVQSAVWRPLFKVQDSDHQSEGLNLGSSTLPESRHHQIAIIIVMTSQDSDSERLKGNVKCFLLTRIVKLKLERP